MKKHTLQKRFGAILLSAALLLPMGVLPAGAVATQEATDAGASLLLQELTEGQPETYAQEEQGPGVLIVELEECPVLETEGLSTDDQGTAQAALLERQQEIEALIRQEVEADFTVLYSYTLTVNGFALSTEDVSIKDKIASLPGVSQVVIAPALPVEEPEEGAETVPETRAGSQYLSLPGYTGKGQLVAVLDSELDVDHRYFQPVPQDPALSQQQTMTLVEQLNQGKPAGEKIDGAAAYRSEKIPFAWSYSNHSQDVSNPAVPHGTHVSGIAVTKVAPDAQLAFFQVLNKAGQIDTAACLMGLEDAAKLGADVINCSFGRNYLNVEAEMSRLLRKAIATLGKQGIPVVAASGNNGMGESKSNPPAANPEYSTDGCPASIPETISVASNSWQGEWMSNSSAWGGNELLMLRPDLSAPGESIVSAYPSDSHDREATLSGTSMSAAQISGLLAGMGEWYEKEGEALAGDLPAALGMTQADYMLSLLMSTSQVFTRTDGTPYAARHQGAGVVQPTQAVEAGAFLAGENSGILRPKVELGEISPDGKVDYRFTVAVTKEALLPQYAQGEVTATVVRNKTTLSGGKRVVSSEMVEIPATLEFALEQEGDQILRATGTLQLDPSALEEGMKEFANGYYVDGFLTLTPTGVAPALHLPLMGFTGGWDKAPVFDGTAYGEEGSVSKTTLYTTLKSSSATTDAVLGASTKSQVQNRGQYLAISPNGDGYGDNLKVNARLLRGANVSWSLDAASTPETMLSKFKAGKDVLLFSQDQLNALPEGFYQLEGDAALPYGGTHSFAQDQQEEVLTIAVDRTAPLVQPVVWREGKNLFLTVDFQDNHMIKALGLYLTAGGQTVPEEWKQWDVDQKQGSKTFDITAFAGKDLRLEVMDYGYNVSLQTFTAGKAMSFTDVKPDAWYYNEVQFAFDNGYLKGMSDQIFSPYGIMSRGMAVTVLYRMAGSPKVSSFDHGFADVEPNRFFYTAVCWAKEKGIMGGTAPTLFEPDKPLSREQLATVLHRYAGLPVGTGDLSAYADADQIGKYAQEAMAWAVGEGILKGQTTTLLAPKGSANRAEFSTMLLRYLVP